jgi:hypothetical protein
MFERRVVLMDAVIGVDLHLEPTQDLHLNLTHPESLIMAEIKPQSCTSIVDIANFIGFICSQDYRAHREQFQAQDADTDVGQSGAL